MVAGNHGRNRGARTRSPRTLQPFFSLLGAPNRIAPRLAPAFARALPLIASLLPTNKNLFAEAKRLNWGERRGTIPRQPDPQSGALPTELLSPENEPYCIKAHLGKSIKKIKNPKKDEAGDR